MLAARPCRRTSDWKRKSIAGVGVCSSQRRPHSCRTEALNIPDGGAKGGANSAPSFMWQEPLCLDARGLRPVRILQLPETPPNE